jgi:hypothetical protein
VTLALWIGGYLLVGLLASKALLMYDPEAMTEDDWKDGAVVFAFTTVVWAWPLWIVAGVLIALFKGLKRFWDWDPKHMLARRKTERIEQELENAAEEGR